MRVGGWGRGVGGISQRLLYCLALNIDINDEKFISFEQWPQVVLDNGTVTWRQIVLSSLVLV